MQNLLLRHCREASGLKQQAIKAETGISAARYKNIEQAEILPTWEEAVVLGKLFKIRPSYLYQYSLQLERLKTSKELLHLQKEKIQQMQQHNHVPVLSK